MKGLTVVGLCLLFGAESLLAETQDFSSLAKQTGLLELYTSEGCSSCPPADKWLSTLIKRPELWQKFVPVAFHVDYWDYIGWQDRFAKPEYTGRQRAFARQQSLKTIYTPGFVYNGREWHNWFVKRLFDFPEGGNPGVLNLSVQNDIVTVQFQPIQATARPLFLNVALLGFGIETSVKAGENSGKKLQHDFVVLQLDQTRLRQRGDSYRTDLALPSSDIAAKRYGIAAWINSQADLTPIQATGGFLN